MEYQFNFKGSLKIPPYLKTLLVNFTVAHLLQDPDSTCDFAKEYFGIFLRLTEGQLFSRFGSLKGEGEYEGDFEEEYRDFAKYEDELLEDDDDTDVDDIVYKKTEEDQILLKEIFSRCLLFKSVNESIMQRVTDVIYPRDVEEGEIIVNQYDMGDKFYIIEEGIYDVLIASEPDAEPVKVSTYNNEGCFGELALFYNMPRAATIKVISPGRLWVMDRRHFKKILSKPILKKRKRYEKLIAGTKLLDNLTPYERMAVADALIERHFAPGELAMIQGGVCEGLHFIEKGTAVVVIRSIESSEDVEVCQIPEKGHFGELELLTNVSNAANVKALTPMRTGFLDRDTFERILGPCKNSLWLQITHYSYDLKRVLGGNTETVKQRQKILKTAEKI